MCKKYGCSSALFFFIGVHISALCPKRESVGEAGESGL